MKKDNRYTITQEFCGYESAKHVVRYCSDYIGPYDTLKEAQHEVLLRTLKQFPQNRIEAIECISEAYITAANWADDVIIDDDFKAHALATSALFYHDQIENIFATKQTFDSAGHDLWLTRQGHGAGFWDRGYDKDISDKLCCYCESIGEFYDYERDADSELN